MTNSFITVEDVNSILSKYGEVNTLHSIDTSNISTESFEDVMYDFCICKHTIAGNSHTFEFQIKNKLWNGRYYLLNNAGEYIDADATYSEDILTFTTSEESIILILYLTNLSNTFLFERLSWISNDLKNVNLFYASEEHPSFHITMLDDSTATGDVLFEFEEYSTTKTIVDESVEYGISSGSHYFNGIVKITYAGCSQYCKVNFIKDIVPILIKENVVASKVNTVHLTIPNDFPSLENGTVYYNNQEIPVDFTNNTFELNLTEKLNNKPVNLKLKVDETDMTMEHTFEYTLDCIFKEIATSEDLLIELNDVKGSRIIELTADIVLTSNILMNHDVKIIGNNHTIDLNHHSFILNEGIVCKAEKVLFTVGNPAIIQKLNSKFSAESCTFTHCTASDYNNLGSVILCDIDLESLNVDTDFTTIINNSHFENNHSCILQGGQLTVSNSTFRNTDTNYIDKNNVAFLYQVDGEATISNSIFDIDYDSNILCENLQNIGSAQAIFKCGINAQINTATHEYLSSDEKALFCEAPFRNTAHLFAKYYYPEIETCVYSSPLISRENKALCYMVTGVNFVFKENVQVTRADANSQNERRTINWEA